jgi:Ca-activated chloride channel family protein
MRFASPWFLLLALAILPMLWRYLRPRRRTHLRFSSVQLLKSAGRSRWSWLRHAPFAARCLAVLALAVALARPQGGPDRDKKSSEGLDIVLILDTSRSMEARDFAIGSDRPSRLAVVKRVIEDFVTERPSDRIGMVVFGTEAFTQAPLTLDHGILLRFLDRVQIGMAGDATAIGDGLATAVNRLKDIEAKSRVAILLTDGGNTAGRVDPLAAAEAAKAKGVKVYTIGVGSKGHVPVEVNGQVQSQKVDVDLELLKQISDATGGQAFMATDTESLVKIYATIDKLEKTRLKIDSFDDYEERYATLAWASLILLLGELALGLTRWRSVP